MKDDLQVQQTLRAELDSGENIVWQGQPKPRIFSGQNAFGFIFSLVWIGMLVFMFFVGTHQKHGSAPPLLFMIPFLFIGIFLLFAPLFQYFAQLRTYYLITNRRALIVVLGRSKKITSYLPEKLESLERRERADGWGDIIIERVSTNYNNRANVREVGFMNIPDVKNVDGLLRDLATRGGKN